MAAVQLSFSLRTSSSVKTVHLLGSWDNYAGQLPLSKDKTSSKSGAWKGTFRFQGATLQAGQRYWYYYIIDGYHVSHDPAQSSTTEPTTGRVLNILDVPSEKSSHKSSPKSSSSSSKHSSSDKERSSRHHSSREKHSYQAPDENPAATVSPSISPRDALSLSPRSSHRSQSLLMPPSTSLRPTTAPQPSRNSLPASAPLLSTSTSTAYRHRHHLPSAPVSPAAPTAILPAPPAPLATIAPQAPRTAPVNAMASPALVTASSWTVEDLAVVIVTIQTLAALPTKSTFRHLPAATAWWFDDE